jgi:hypothetical protein
VEINDSRPQWQQKNCAGMGSFDLPKTPFCHLARIQVIMLALDATTDGGGND